MYAEVVAAGMAFLDHRPDFWNDPKPNELGVVSDLGMALRRLDRRPEARKLMERAIPHFRRVYGPHSLYTLRVEATLCQILADLGEAGASERLRTLLEEARRNGVPTAECAAYRPTLVAILLTEGKLAEAREIVDETIRTAKGNGPGAALFTRLSLAMATDLIRHGHAADAHRTAEAVREQVARYYGSESETARGCERLIADSVAQKSSP